ncbi:MAG: hypothetical protein JWR63_2310 [Conexibacter sp.]|nr:hypothetical protein [Conexibacter sp.]
MITWLRTVRANGHMSWIKPGPFVPREADGFYMAERANLPPGFRYVAPTLVQLGPGVTALVVEFGLAEEEQRTIETALRQPADPVASPLKGGGHSVRYPQHVKEQRVADLRSDYRARASAWVANHGVGVFASQDKTLPAWDFLASTVTDLAPPRNDRDRVEWRDVLGLHWAERWVAPEDEVTLAIPTGSRETGAVPSFVGRRAQLIGNLGEGRHPELSGVASMLNEYFAPVLGLWAAVRAVQVLDEQISLVADSPAPKATYRSTRRQLERLRDVVLPVANDLSTLAHLSDALASERSAWWFEFNAGDLELEDAQDEPSLVKWLVKRLGEETQVAARRSDQTIQLLKGYSDNLVSTSNLRLQRTVLWLSIVVAIMTAATIWLAAKQNTQDEPRRSQDSPAAHVDPRAYTWVSVTLGCVRSARTQPLRLRVQVRTVRVYRRCNGRPDLHPLVEQLDVDRTEVTSPVSTVAASQA